MFKGMILSAIKSALIEKVANEQQRNALISVGVNTALTAINDKYNVSKTNVAKALAEKGLDRSFVETTLVQFLGTIAGVGANYLVDKIDHLDLSSIIDKVSKAHRG